MAKQQHNHDQQRRIVGEGLALGAASLSALEYPSVPADAAFQRAWRDWSRRDVFPSIQAGLSGSDLFYMVSKSEGRSMRKAYWEKGGPGGWHPVLHDDYTAAEVAEYLQDIYKIPVTLEDWTNLARTFTEKPAGRA